jgi:hypothetical protein
MCGLDPCLCGVPDEYGACACNGTETVLPTVSVVGDSSGVVKVVQLGSDWWLIPWGVGEARFAVDASLPRHESAGADFEAKVDTPFSPFLFFTGGLIVLLICVCVALWWLVRRKGAAAVGRAGCAVLLALGLVLGSLFLGPLFGCAAPLRVAADSPRVALASIASLGDGSEGGQRVELRLVFDGPLLMSGDVLAGLEMGLNGKPLDEGAIAVAARLEGSDTLLLTLSPAEGTGDTNSGRYFAVYEGLLSVSARDSSGGVAGLVAAGGSGAGAAEGGSTEGMAAAAAADGSAAGANAVIEGEVLFQIPSGLVIEIVETVRGEAASGTCARAVFRVVEVPCIRAVSWIALEAAGERALVHNHEFSSYLDGAAGRERYAAFLVEPLRRSFDSGYTVSATGDTVTIVAREATDGELLEPFVVEGVME